MRRLLLAFMPALLAACISSQPYPKGIVEAQPQPTPLVRPPKVGQEWVYQVRNVFNQEIIDTVTERVISVGNEIRIARSGVKAGPCWRLVFHLNLIQKGLSRLSRNLPL